MRVAEQLAAEGCPLCGWRSQSDRRFVDAVVGEAVNDTGVRRRLEASGGYCSRHVALLPARERERRGGTLGSAILLGSVMRARLAGLDEATSSGRRRLPGRVGLLREAPVCPLCRDVGSSVVSAVTVLIGRLHDPAWAAVLAESLLCLDDLLLLWDAAARSGDRALEAWRPVAASQSDRFRAILAVADAYVDHSGHDRQAEMTGEERVAADGLVRALAGDVEPGR